jgi:hypothetical protein
MTKLDPIDWPIAYAFPRGLSCPFSDWDRWRFWREICADSEAVERAKRLGRSGVDCIERAKRSWPK